ncbi:TetR/AcrR family transcriptional regulator [Oceanicoccus sagamiensis]|uniref:HTH tetR-type domain-containing protein n=1 Tax=Oceanicoccus sagamiensis TaxID=716816 RepID=A0A1X9NI40_9GAMM|nr:TetR/AcrR family transcriptional regulator [Oceanicoccus sagamiensis]ARN75179.1 hypothetical protein BST96_14270 [Oceanicoccus sagamiensis]
MPTKNAATPKEPSEDGVKWQAQKSSMTRDRILDATIDGFIKLGYSKLTTTQVADIAGISRGAMRHHFDSKKELIQAAIEHLHKKLLGIYFHNLSSIPQGLTGRELIRARVDAYWSYLNEDLVLVHQELCMTARTEPELKDIITVMVKALDDQARQSVLGSLDDFEEDADRLFFIIDITRFNLEALARGKWQLSLYDDQLVERQLQHLTLCIEQVVNDDGTTDLSKLFANYQNINQSP